MFQQTEDELKHHLEDQIQFLKYSSVAYDNGFESEAKRLAVSLRILFHDTNKSMSLLASLKKKDILLYDTSTDFNPSNLVSHLGLVMIELSPAGAKYKPPLDNGPPIRYKRDKIPFPQWWDKIILADMEGNTLSRKILVLSVCDKDGGAHVDTKLNQAYSDITRRNTLGWKTIDSSGKENKLATKPELASIRQICHEVLKSFKDIFPEFFQ
jgi:hypothetical protein